MASKKKRDVQEARLSFRRSFKRYWDLYLLLLLPIIYFCVFKYRPMAALIIAFKDFNIKMGYFGSPWAKIFDFETATSKVNIFAHFIRFFQSAFFWQTLWNTVSLSIMQLLFSFPIPILLALIMNEIKKVRLKKTLQMVTYVPHFISTVVLIAIVQAMVAPQTGIVNRIVMALGGQSTYYLSKPEWFKPLYIISGIWQNAGYSSIIYLATLTNIDPQLIEAAKIDGANRLKIIWHIMIPGILPTAITLLIINFGKVMNVGFEKVYLMQNSMNSKTSEVISTYIYKQFMDHNAFSYSTAVGLFNALINIILLVAVNKISKKVSDTSLW
ncbi:MAG: sugar ABC transporter permease [Lachnospiraceae bacterium]|nr:sugar ABC transporter permease [Lachnospiraceae bacterium]